MRGTRSEGLRRIGRGVVAAELGRIGRDVPPGACWIGRGVVMAPGRIDGGVVMAPGRSGRGVVSGSGRVDGRSAA